VRGLRGEKVLGGSDPETGHGDKISMTGKSTPRTRQAVRSIARREKQERWRKKSGRPTFKAAVRKDGVIRRSYGMRGDLPRDL